MLRCFLWTCNVSLTLLSSWDSILVFVWFLDIFFPTPPQTIRKLWDEHRTNLPIVFVTGSDFSKSRVQSAVQARESVMLRRWRRSSPLAPWAPSSSGCSRPGSPGSSRPPPPACHSGAAALARGRRRWPSPPASCQPPRQQLQLHSRLKILDNVVHYCHEADCWPATDNGRAVSTKCLRHFPRSAERAASRWVSECRSSRDWATSRPPAFVTSFPLPRRQKQLTPRGVFEAEPVPRIEYSPTCSRAHFLIWYSIRFGLGGRCVFGACGSPTSGPH